MLGAIREIKPLGYQGWLEHYNLQHFQPGELETCLFRYHFSDGRVVEHVSHNVLIRGSLNLRAEVEGHYFALRGSPQDRDYTEEGYRLHAYDEE